MTTRRPFSFLPTILCGLALGASVLLAGCGGGGNDNPGNGNTGGGGNNGGGGGNNSAIVGVYQLTALGNAATGQTQPCPGTLAFGGNNSDACGPAGVLTFNADGTGSVSQAGVTTQTGTYTLNGSTLTFVSTDATTHQSNTDVFSVATSGNTVTVTRVSSTDPTNPIGEQLVLTKTSGGGAVSPFAGSYQGVYLNTSGQFSPAAGTIAVTVSSSGAITGSTFDFTGDSSTNPITGTVSSTGALVLNPGADQVSGTLSQDSTTHVLSASYTESNGTHGLLRLGLAPTASPLAGSYSGTVTGSSGQFPMTLTISSGGAVTGTLGTPSATNPDLGFNFAGYVDASGNLYTAETSGGGREIIVGGLTLNGTSLTGTVQSSGADGSSTTATLSLTKQ